MSGTGPFAWEWIILNSPGWILDTEAMEWKKIQFKASVTGQKGSFARRMTGLIQDRPVPLSVQGGPGGRRGSASRGTKSGKITFADLAGAAASSKPRATIVGAGAAGGSRKSTWQNVLKSKMDKNGPRGTVYAPRADGEERGEAGGAPGGAFHNDLVNVVSQGAGLEPDESLPTNVPTQRANHSLSLLQESSVALFGGHGGSGYSRRAFNDTWLLNLDNNRWTCLVCQGNPPAPRSGHTSFTKDGYLYIFGGWNNDSQFCDFFYLDVENKDWTDLDLNWSVPRWNHNMQLVEAIPSWRVFVFGGSADTAGSGRLQRVV